VGKRRQTKPKQQDLQRNLLPLLDNNTTKALQDIIHDVINLRNELRKTHARIREETYNTIMKASTDDQQLFYRLIKQQRKTTDDRSITSLRSNGTVFDGPDEILEGWATYFEGLGQPLSEPTFDEQYRQMVETDITYIKQLCRERNPPQQPFTEQEVSKAVTSQSNQKASDSEGISAEHLK
jgi:hypothetical protein